MPDPTYEAKYGPGPHLTADAVVKHGAHLAVIKRRSSGLWALPGGFLDPGETFQQCALREFKEEAGVDLEAEPNLILNAFYPVAFDDPDRDPRSRIISGAVKIILSPDSTRPKLTPGDDAIDADWFLLSQVPQLYADHNEVIRVLHQILL